LDIIADLVFIIEFARQQDFQNANALLKENKKTIPPAIRELLSG
jgi:hypothetical protein